MYEYTVLVVLVVLIIVVLVVFVAFVVLVVFMVLLVLVVLVAFSDCCGSCSFFVALVDFVHGSCAFCGSSVLVFCSSCGSSSCRVDSKTYS